MSSPTIFREAGLRGSRARWGPPRHLSTGDLPAPERQVIGDLLIRVRVERARQGLPPTISDRAAVAAIAAVLVKETGPTNETSGPVATGGTRDARRQPER